MGPLSEKWTSRLYGYKAGEPAGYKASEDRDEIRALFEQVLNSSIRTWMRSSSLSNRWHLFKGDQCDNRSNFIPIEAL